MKTISALAMLAAAAAPTYAVDGVVLINQNAALAGNVTPGDAPGFPVTISVPGNYRLSGNLTVPDASTTAISITVDNVAIDLNGFSIIGPTVCAGLPLSCTPTGAGAGIISGVGVVQNISISNGDIRGMGGRGISLSGAGHRIKEVRAFNNGSSGILAANATVQSCTANNNGGAGIVSPGLAIDNIAIGNRADGIEFDQPGVAVNNLATSNSGNGISGRATFTGNFAYANQLVGILAFCFSSVTSNTAVNNMGGDILTAGTGCTRANNAPAP